MSTGVWSPFLFLKSEKPYVMLRPVKFHTFQILLFLFLFFSSSLLYGRDCSQRTLVEADKLCHEKGLERGALAACLNDYARSILREGGLLSCQFAQEIGEFLSRNNISQEVYLSKVPYTSLDKAFRIVIPEAQTDRGWCIAEDDSSQIEALQKQIKSIAFFLKQYHVRALGQQPSVLFTIREVELCDYDREPILRYELGKLSIDLKPQESSVIDERSYQRSEELYLYNAEKMWALWEGGEHYKFNLLPPREEEDKGWFHFEVQLFPKSVERMAEKMETLASLPLAKKTDYILYKTWGILNPVGRFRTKVRLELAKIGLEKSQSISRILKENGTDGFMSSIVSKFRESGLDTEKLEEQFRALSGPEKERLSDLFKEKLTSVTEQAKYIQCSIGNSMQEEVGEETHIDRDLEGSVVVTNAHFIDVKASLSSYFNRNDCVDLEKYISPLSSEQERKAKVRSVRHNIKGVIIVDTFDQVQVNLSMASDMANKIPLELNAFIEALHEVKKN